jgi:hypothetical protein
MHYTFTCAEHNAVMSVEAKNDEEALEKLTKAAKEHIKTDHAGGKPMNDEQIRQMLRDGWKKEASKKES